MSMHRTIIRYFLIINRVKRPGFPSFGDIREMLTEHDFDVSTRTLQRDIGNIRTDFGIEIRYNSYHKGYYLDRDNSPDLDSLMKFLEMAVLTGTFNELYRDANEAKEFVSFDAEAAIKGVEYFSKILFALKNRKQLVIKYQKFTEEDSFQVELKPGLFKEYQNRWYLVGIRVNSGDRRAYALDRIRGLSIGEESFSASEVADIKERFAHVIGISLTDHKPEFIKLTFNTEQAKYIETLPWHPSQEVIHRDDQTTTFSLFVVPNYELIQKILAEGNHIQKIEPEWFNEQVYKRK